MQTGNLFTRDDTFFGVCEGLGEDLGFNANWLRALFAAGLLFNPVAVLATYAALGVVVLASRLIFRKKVAKVEAVTETAVAANSNDKAPAFAQAA